VTVERVQRANDAEVLRYWYLADRTGWCRHCQSGMIPTTQCREQAAKRGIDRRNQTRVAEERRAQAVRSSQPAKNYRVDQAAPMFQHNAPSVGNSGGGGGSGPVGPLFLVALLALRRFKSKRS